MNSPSSQSLFTNWFAIDPDHLSASEQKLLRLTSNACMVLVACVVLITIASTYLDVRRYAGDDLRNRVVGARVMLAGYDPYTFVWQPDMPEQWLDPVCDSKAHRLTASPPTLLLYAVIAPYPYSAQRFISFTCEWLALLVSLALLAWNLPNLRLRFAFLLGATLFVIATDVWRMHLERGQFYVFALLALSAAIACSRGGQKDSIGTGIALGILALMRPNLLVIAPGLLLLRQWRSSSAMLAIVSAGVIATLLVMPMSSWQSYLGVGDQYFRKLQDPHAVPDLRRPFYEGPVEGVQFGNSLPYIESSSFAQLVRTLHEQIDWPMIDVALTSKLIVAATAFLMLTLIWRRRGSDVRYGFALIVVMSLDTEFFLPHRWGYTDVMLLAPLALLLPELLTSRFALGVVLLGLLSGPVGQHVFGLYAATVLRSWLVMGGLTWLAICRSEPDASRKHAAVN